jgi:hypothetical protein
MDGELKTFVARLTASTLALIDQRKRPLFLMLLDAAFADVPPAYASAWFGDLFRKRAREADWVASLLASDSYMEGYSAGRLWQYSGIQSDRRLGNSLRRHAMDEARHSKMFTSVLFKTFPNIESEPLRTEMATNTPDLATHPTYPTDYPAPGEEELLNSMIMVNLFEIKALVLGKLFRPVVTAYAPEDAKIAVDGMMSAILEDEGHHIAYSASVIEDACCRGQQSYVEVALRDFQDAQNRVAVADLDRDWAREATL